MCFSSYSNQRLNRTPSTIKNLNQYDFELGTNTIRNESQLLNFIETTMETYLIPVGQLRTTSNDLAKFLSAFNNDGLYNGIKLLNLETIEIIKTIHYPNVAYDQGLIWHYKSLNESNLFGHGGSDLGSDTEMFQSSLA